MYEVLEGDLVYLEVRQSNGGGPSYSCQATVKRVQRLMTKDSHFEIALELAVPGNIWGIKSPPDDWFPMPVPKSIELGSTRRGQPLAARTEQKVAPTLNEESARHSQTEKDDATAPLSPSFRQRMAGFGEQIQLILSQAATAAFVKEREHLMGEICAQQNEATRKLECEISPFKDELTRRVLKELIDAHEAAARITYERWNKQIEQDMKNAAQGMVAQAIEVSRRFEDIMVSAVERQQRNMEASRNETADRFLSRLGEKLAPLLEDAHVTLQNLTSSEKRLRAESQAIRERFDNFLQQTTHNSVAEVQEKALGMLEQFESDVTKRVVESHDSVNERSVEIVEETTKILRELSRACEETVQCQLRLLVSSAADYLSKVLKERTA